MSHVNQRNVVLCLLEVARIACTKHSFTPAPGLVEFEQEIDREIENELQQQQSLSMCEPDYLKMAPKHIQSGERNVCRKLWDNDEPDMVETHAGTLVNADVWSVGNDATPVGDCEPVDNFVVAKISEKNVVNGAVLKKEETDEDDDDDDNSSIINNQLSIDDTESKDGGFVDDCGSCSSSSDIRRSPSTNSVISSASSTYLEMNCGGSSTSSSTPTPMTSELDHKVSKLFIY